MQTDHLEQQTGCWLRQIKEPKHRSGSRRHPGAAESARSPGAGGAFGGFAAAGKPIGALGGVPGFGTSREAGFPERGGRPRSEQRRTGSAHSSSAATRPPAAAGKDAAQQDRYPGRPLVGRPETTSRSPKIDASALDRGRGLYWSRYWSGLPRRVRESRGVRLG